MCMGKGKLARADLVTVTASQDTFIILPARSIEMDENTDTTEIVSEDNLISVEEFARQKAFSSNQVIENVKAGKLAEEVGGEQRYVNLRLSRNMQK